MHHSASSENHFVRIYFSTFNQTFWTELQITSDKDCRANTGKIYWARIRGGREKVRMHIDVWSLPENQYSQN
jgi:hypothetical protein